jgi:hypothetical protein
MWDGKATAGNQALLSSGSFVPVSAAGTKYSVKVCVSNPGGAKLSRATAVKLYNDPIISKFGASPAGFVATGSGYAKITYQINHMSNVDIRIVNSSAQTVAEFTFVNVKPNVLQTLQWNGTATAGNSAGLAAGSAVPSGDYSVQVCAGNTTYTDSTIIELTSP